MNKIYTILLDSIENKGICKGRIFITEIGAKTIWSAYEKLYGKNCQTMESRQKRGGVCWLSEIDYFKKENVLSKDFNWKDFEVVI